ncbi:cell envelope integrity protein TolA [Bradyrhizobium sp.]|uniref:cell envelope integrity protein TolA n=1 Tax=Bradyrhizobium sp. TaxID=376 RepID=UPI003C258238
MKVKVDKTLAASIVLHVLVIGWGLVSFSTRAFVMPEEDSIPVDMISADQLAKVTAGMKSGKKENPKPLVEKVAEAKPIDDAMGKITEKAPVVTDTTPPPPPPPKPVEKPVEKKPDPPKPVAEEKPKEEQKPVEKKPDAPDPIAEALKKEEKKPPPKPQVQAATPPPQPPKPKERTFDQSKIAALLDKRDPSHQAATGDTLNSNAALGTSKGKADAIVATWKGAFAAAVRRCFNFPYNGMNADQFEVDIDIQMQPDGKVASQPVVVGVRGPSKSIADALGESARRAVEQCQPYALPKDQYQTWKYIPMTFGLKDML